jgi:hypothetical protein
MEITFQTRLPLRNETGLKMWEHGSYFGAEPGHGGRTYRLKTAGEATSLIDAVTSVGDVIRELVSEEDHADDFGTNEAMVIDVKAARE